jgi:hypothetical protein
MKGSKPVLGGAITAVIAAIAVGITVYGNRAPQTVPVAKASDPGGRPLAAVGTQHSLRELSVAAGRIAEEELQERGVTLDTGDTLMEILLTVDVPRQEAYAASTAMEKVYDPRDLRAGQKIKIFLRDTDGLKKKWCFGLPAHLLFTPACEFLECFIGDAGDMHLAKERD